MLFTASIFLFKNNILSQNLIQNGNFENYTADPGSSGCVTQFDSLKYWEAIQSPDVFTSLCTFTNHYGVPYNKLGTMYSKNGNAYIGLGEFNLPYETKEYIYQHLTNPLIAGKTYFTSFFVSKADRVKYAIKNIGVCFSVSQPTVVNISDPYIIANPQVENQLGFLTDTINWIEISGYFTAQGGEQYITIGNFNSNANTDTINSGTNNPIPFDNGTAYYYIDSVSLYDSLDYALITNIKRIENDIKLNIYPNPNNGNFNIDYDLKNEAEFIITDITGRLINQYNLLSSQNNLSIKEAELEAGIYFYSLRNDNEILKQNKIIIIK